MKKQSPRFFFRLQPTKQLKPTLGAASHYAENNGLVTLDPLVALYIANCVRAGQPPQVFVQGWWSEAEQSFTVGIAVPRTESTARSPQPHKAPSESVSSLSAMFTE
jgi:hypothetical protein